MRIVTVIFCTGFLLTGWRGISESIPKTLPNNSADTYFPYETRQQEIDRCRKDPLIPEKLLAIEEMRQKVPIQKWDWHKIIPAEKIMVCVEKINDDGSFTDLTPESALADHVKRRTSIGKAKRAGEAFMDHAADRLRPLIEHWNRGTLKHTPENKQKLLRAFNYHLGYEYFRRDGRWVASAFNMPQLACVGYFSFLADMDAVERGTCDDPDLRRFNALCKAVASQCFFEERSNRPGPVLTVESFSRQTHWTSGNFGYRPLLDTALMCRNPLMIDVMTEVIRKSLQPVSHNTRKSSFWSDGLCADGLGWGHGRQNYITRYPSSYVQAILTQMARLKGTLWYRDFSEKHLQYPINYLKSSIWYCYHAEKHGATPLTPDRLFFQYPPFKPHRGFGMLLSSCAAMLKHLEPETPEAKEIRHCMDVITSHAPDLSGSRYFWNNDDLIFRRPDFFIGIGMVSSRSDSNEVVAATSIKTDFLGDGITALMKRPGTYSQAKGFWNPCAIPGITARQGKYEHKNDTWIGYTGVHNFAGGVAENGSGAAGFIYEKAERKGIPTPHLYKVRARKAYFAFESELVCLGTDITNLNSEIEGTIQTTVDQTEWIDSLEYCRNGTVSSVIPGTSVQENAEMAVHSGIGYAALQGTFKVKAETRKERWLEFAGNFNRNRSDRPRTLPILELSFDHGRKAAGASYAYLVNMRSDNMAELRKYLKQNPVTILSNTAKLQAVRHNELKITQAVFYSKEATMQTAGGNWSTNAPVVLQIREKKDGKIVITVNDPKQNPKLKSITLSCDSIRFELPLPQGVYCGQPVSKEFTL